MTFLLSFEYGVSLNNGKYRPWMLANTLFLSALASGLERTFICLKGRGPLNMLKETKCTNYLCFGIFIIGVYERQVLCVTSLEIEN